MRYSIGRRGAVVAAVATVAAVAVGIAWAAIPSGGVITACFTKNGGALRVIDAQTSNCTNKEQRLDWGVAGPSGPAGATGPSGASGAKGDTGATGPSGPSGASGATGPSGDSDPTTLKRIVANSTTQSYSASNFGTLFYDRTLPANSSDALYITVTGTGHQANGDILSLLCTFGGSQCGGPFGGHVTVGNSGANSWPDNSFTATWCVVPGTATQRVQLFLIPTSLTNTIYIEHVSVQVDGSDTPGACSDTGFQTQ